MRGYEDESSFQMVFFCFTNTQYLLARTHFTLNKLNKPLSHINFIL